jgi:hypothetical protein
VIERTIVTVKLGRKARGYSGQGLSTMWLVFAALQRGGRNQAVEPILLFGCQSLSIGGGWNPVVTYSSLDGYYSACGARGGKKIEDTLALGRLLDEYNDIVVFRGETSKPLIVSPISANCLTGTFCSSGEIPRRWEMWGGKKTSCPCSSVLLTAKAKRFSVFGAEVF